MFQIRLSSPYFVNPVSTSANGAVTGSSSSSASATSATPAVASSTNVTLSAEAKSQLDQLSQTDKKVRAHEQAHMAAGGGLILSGPTFSYQKGADGKMYAVGGDVSIDTSPGQTPQETISRAEQVRSAALAPVDPSSQDRQVAAAASNMEMEATLALAAAQKEGGSTTSGRSEQKDSGDQSSYPSGQMQSFYAAVAAIGEANSSINTAA